MNSSRSIARNLVLLVTLLAAGVSILLGRGDPLPPSLKTIQPLKPPNLNQFVTNETTLVQLGKAMFWDMQAGSDGKVACATCHFHAGADHRNKNTINRGPNNTFNTGGPNYVLQPGDFPLSKPGLPSDSDDIISSQGVSRFNFVDIVPGSAVDNCTAVADPVFQVAAVNVRRVAGINTPTVLNTTFNLRNLWNGRGYHTFNGRSVSGPFDAGAHVLVADASGVLSKDFNVRLLVSSAASQAVSVLTNDVIMSCTGRTLPKFGKKMLSLTPLGKQNVSPTDSVLGSPLAVTTGPSPKGLNTTYAALIMASFASKYWSSDRLVDGSGNQLLDGSGNPRTGPPANTNEFTQMEYNFVFFWGLAVQAWENTLVSNEALFDRVQEGLATFNTSQALGASVFTGKGDCIACHNGPLFSNATTPELLDSPTQANRLMDRRKMKDGNTALFDVGFFNIGVRPTSEGIGLGATAPFNPLSFTRMATGKGVVGPGGVTPFPQLDKIGYIIDACRFHENKCQFPTAAERDFVNGSHKVPSLRNVEFTGPTFHNGGKLTLAQAIALYNNGGDFKNAELDREIAKLGLTAAQIQGLVDFLNTLTDDRVRLEKAPFDHPQLCVANGHQGDTNLVVASGITAVDNFVEIPAVGASGHPLLFPLQTFDQLLNGVNAGVAHNLQTACPF